MAGLTDYAENKTLDHILGVASWASAQRYVGLLTAAPTDSTGGTEVSTSGTGYVRQAVTFAAASGGASSNSALIDFGTASGAYGTVTHVGIYDAASAGNLLAYAALSASKTVAASDSFQIPIGDLDISLD